MPDGIDKMNSCSISGLWIFASRLGLSEALEIFPSRFACTVDLYEPFAILHTMKRVYIARMFLRLDETEHGKNHDKLSLINSPINQRFIFSLCFEYLDASTD